MSKITKLTKIVPANETAKTEKAPPNKATETSQPKRSSKSEPEVIGGDQNKYCLIVVGYFIFIYLAMVASFWMMSSFTHQSDRTIDALRNAETPVEMRDQLVALFGAPKWLKIDAPSLSDADQKMQEAVKSMQQSATDAATKAVTDSVTSGIKEGVQSVNPTTPSK